MTLARADEEQPGHNRAAPMRHVTVPNKAGAHVYGRGYLDAAMMEALRPP